MKLLKISSVIVVIIIVTLFIAIANKTSEYIVKAESTSTNSYNNLFDISEIKVLNGQCDLNLNSPCYEDFEVIKSDESKLLIKIKVLKNKSELFYYYVKDLEKENVEFIREGFYREFETGWLNNHEFYSWESFGSSAGDLLITNINTKEISKSSNFIPKNILYNNFSGSFEDGRYLIFGVGALETKKYLIWDRQTQSSTTIPSSLKDSLISG